nr:putative ribonuclease H-like domain-containing protein [Tanacetum cinerariifolium]
MRPFGCPVTILNTLDFLGKFDGKVDEGFLVGYYVSSKAFRVFNSRTRIVQETLHVNFLENKANIAGNQTNLSAGFQDKIDAEKAGEEIDQQYMLFPAWSSDSANPQNNDGDAAFDGKEHDFDAKKPESESLKIALITVLMSAAGPLNAAASPTYGKSSFIDASQLLDDPDMPELENIIYSDDENNVGAEADFNNLETSITVNPIPTTRVHKDHPVSQIIGDLSLTTQIRRIAQEGTSSSQRSKNKKDERGIVVRNKARLVTQGHTQEEGIDYEEVFVPVARIEAIRLFLAYASFMGFMVYQMDVKSAFLYGNIMEKVYVCQPPGFEDPDHPNKVYKVVKALYGLHQDPRAWYETLANYLLKNGFQRGKIDQTLFVKRQVPDGFNGGTHILFGSLEGKSASTHINTEKPLLKDPDGEDVDMHTYRVLVTKPRNKTPYELLHGRTPSIGFMRPFGCPVTILNTLDFLGKFDGKVDEGFLVGYSVSSKAFKVFNSRTRVVQETLHVNFLENKPNVAGCGPTWLFYIDSLIRTMNYQPVTAGNQTNPSVGFQDKFDAEKAGEEIDQQYVLFPVWSSGSINPHNYDGDVAFDGKEHNFDAKKPESEFSVSPSSSAQSRKQYDMTKKEAKRKSPVKSFTGYRDLSAEFEDCSDNSINEVNVAGTIVPTVRKNSPNSTNTFELEDITYYDDDNDAGVEADFNNLETSITVSPIPTIKVHKDHPVSQIIGDLSSTTQTRSMTRVVKDQGVNTPRSDEDRLELMELTIFLLPKVEKVEIGVNVNDVTRLQALVDKKKVVIIEATIRDALCLDDADGLNCLSNKEFFAELARMGYEKPSTKLTFYKALFSSQWKFLIHTILQCMNAKRTSWNEFCSSMVFVVICLSSGDISTHTTKYTSPALTQKGDAEGDTNEHVKEVNIGDAAEGDNSAAHGEVSTVAEELSIPSPTPPTPPPQPPQDIPSTSQVQQTPSLSPHVQPPQPQPQQAIDFPLSLLQEAIDACAALTKRVEHLEYDKVAQALEITKLKKRVKKLEKRNKVSVEAKKVAEGGMIAKIDKDDVVVWMDNKEEDKNAEEAKVDESAQVQRRQAESQAEIYKIDMDRANKVLSMQEDKTEPAEVQEVVDVVTTAKLITEVVTSASEIVTTASAIITTTKAQVPTATTATLTVAPIRVVAAPSRRRKGVIIRDPKEESTTSTIIPAETKSKDKSKGILVEEPRPFKKKQQIEQDEQFARKLNAELNKDIDWDEAINHVKLMAKEDTAIKRYHAMKRKP